MAYLNLDTDFFEHPKTKRLVGIVGKGAELCPLKLWAYCGKYHPEDGKLRDYSRQEIAALCGWEGDPETLIEAMLKVGFLDQRKDVLSVHDWLEHEGHICSFRRRATQAAKMRWAKLSCKNAPSNAQEKTSNTPSVPTNHTVLAGRSTKPRYPQPAESSNGTL